MRPILLPVLTGTAAFALVMGAAASLLVDTDDLGAGTIDVAACDPDGVDVEYVTSPVDSDGTTAPDAVPTTTDTLDPSSGSVGEPAFFVTHVRVTGLDASCVGQRLEVSLFCDANLDHTGDPATGLGAWQGDQDCPDGDGRFRFLSSNNRTDGPRGETVTADAQMFDVVDVQAALVDQVSVLVTGEEAVEADEAVALPPSLVGHWTFEPGEEYSDRTGNFAPIQMFGSTTVVDGVLRVRQDDRATSTRATAGTIREKTLVSRVSLTGSLDDRGAGSALTLQTPDGVYFDAIVYAEREARRWMAGSNNFDRTQDLGAADESQLDTPIVMSISYTDVGGGAAGIEVCRNGVSLGSYSRGSLLSWSGSAAQTQWGRRHGTSGSLQADIDESWLYDEPLSCADAYAYAGGS